MKELFVAEFIYRKITDNKTTMIRFPTESDFPDKKGNYMIRIYELKSTKAVIDVEEQLD